MRTKLFARLLGMGLILGVGAVASAQEPGAGSNGSLRVAWTDGPMGDGWRAICGSVYNDRGVPARNVRIEVQGLGETGQLISRRERYLTADVPAASRSVFCLPMAAGAAAYRVTVLGADWGFNESP
jgi:hypothetical protein